MQVERIRVRRQSAHAGQGEGPHTGEPGGHINGRNEIRTRERLAENSTGPPGLDQAEVVVACSAPYRRSCMARIDIVNQGRVDRGAEIGQVNLHRDAMPRSGPQLGPVPELTQNRGNVPERILGQPTPPDRDRTDGWRPVGCRYGLSAHVPRRSIAHLAECSDGARTRSRAIAGG